MNRICAYFVGALLCLAVGLVVPAVSDAQPSGIREVRPPVLLYRCGAPGEACCRWRNATPNVDPRYCKVDAGCDITTDTCVSPCGGPGQPCCDGPDTFAPQGNQSPTGALFCPGGGGPCTPRKQMCATGVCNVQTRRCDVNCGRIEGQACCTHGADFAVGTCLDPKLVCNNPLSSEGKCLRCGQLNGTPCPDGSCQAQSPPLRLSAVTTDTCVPCGSVGQPICGSQPVCDDGATQALPGSQCVACGEAGQLACSRGTPCRGLAKPEGRRCVAVGKIGTPCHDGQCEPGATCDGGMCVACGLPGQPCCNGLCRRRNNTCDSNRCVGCGLRDAKPCSWGCEPGLQERYGACRAHDWTPSHPPGVHCCDLPGPGGGYVRYCGPQCPN